MHSLKEYGRTYWIRSISLTCTIHPLIIVRWMWRARGGGGYGLHRMNPVTLVSVWMPTNTLHERTREGTAERDMDEFRGC